ncbi:MAG TPA: hypothetical protein VM409_07825, partial [Chloroflexia bacterium]|nr:hypothetical protein [Chloroflexia bacterium]
VNPVQKTDLQRRKRTLPIVFALRDDSEEPNALQIAYSSDAGAVDEELLRESVQSAGGIAFGELLIRVYRENALAALEELELLRPGSKAILRPLLPEVAED